MLDFHKEQFAQALHDSSNDRALTVEYLTQALEDASNTSTNWERKNINFESVKDMDHDEALKVTELTQQNGWENTYRQIHTLEATDPVAAQQLEYVMDKMLNVYARLSCSSFHPTPGRPETIAASDTSAIPSPSKSTPKATSLDTSLTFRTHHRTDLRRNLAVRLIGRRSRGGSNPGTPGTGPGPVNDGHHRPPEPASPPTTSLTR